GDLGLVEEHRDELFVPAVLGPNDLERGEALRLLNRAPEPDARHPPLGDGRGAEPLEGQLLARRGCHRSDATPGRRPDVREARPPRRQVRQGAEIRLKVRYPGASAAALT